MKSSKYNHSRWPGFRPRGVIQILAAAAVSAAVAFAPDANAAVACFTSKEADAAHLRVMLQQIDVAALNCRGTGYEDLGPTRDQLVTQLSAAIRENATALRAHFRRFGGEGALDRWMTQVANTAAIQAASDGSYCNITFDVLRKALPLPPVELVSYASGIEKDQTIVPVCAEKKPVVRASTKRPAAKKPAAKKPVGHTAAGAAPAKAAGAKPPAAAQ